FFFFQAEDGIRDRTVTGVQTCALPISLAVQQRKSREFLRVQTALRESPDPVAQGSNLLVTAHELAQSTRSMFADQVLFLFPKCRSEERGVGKVLQSRRSTTE